MAGSGVQVASYHQLPANTIWPIFTNPFHRGTIQDKPLISGSDMDQQKLGILEQRNLLKGKVKPNFCVTVTTFNCSQMDTTKSAVEHRLISQAWHNAKDYPDKTSSKTLENTITFICNIFFQNANQRKNKSLNNRDFSSFFGKISFVI